MESLSFINQLPDEAKTVKHQYLKALITRIVVKRACIALANKAIRADWALLRYNKPYQPKILMA